MLYEGLVIDNTYQIIREIGSGGMGVVYLAYHLRLKKYVVMKRIKNSSFDLTLLRNEVDVLKSLHHPYLPQVYDFIEYNSDLYTIIDYINGYDLDYYIKNRYSPSNSQIIKWLKQLCEVLSYLHSHNVLHSDIKPANIIATEDGNICLIDFGISLNNSNVIKGISKFYSSPEQYSNYVYLKYNKGQYCDLDSRSDLYSLAATFYHLTTGVQPSFDKALYPVSSYNSNISESVSNIISKAMQYNPDDRYKDADAMLKAIDNIKKEDVRYKRYILLQILSSVICGAMIIGGIVAMFSGYSNYLSSSYESDYKEMLDDYKSGDYESTASKGRAILNNSTYSGVLKGNNKSEILHLIGDCYYLQEDYSNAETYYKDAINLTEASLKSTYYMDLAFAKIQNNEINEAEKISADIQNLYGGSVEIYLINSEINFKKGNYSQAVSESNSIITKYSGNSEYIISAYEIIANSYSKMNNHLSASENYAKLYKLSPSKYYLCKQAQAYMNANSYTNAYSCYLKICSSYKPDTEDIVNLAQCCIYSSQPSEYGKCKDILKEYSIEHEELRVYIMLTLIADLDNDPNVSEYCEKAHYLYLKAGESKRRLIDEDALSKMRDLYYSYKNEEW